MAKMTLILGGARSGKSLFAEGLAKKYNDVVYIATAEVKDDEMRERIRIHRDRRPRHWNTVESPFHVGKVVSGLKGDVSLVFIDCITLYITNMLLRNEIDAGREGEMSETIPPPSADGGGECDGGKVFSDTAVNSSSCSGTSEKNLERRQEYILAEINKLCKICRESKSDVIVVSNEVGLGIVPDSALSRIFRDIAGYANQVIAKEADEVFFMVAGIAQRVK